MENHVFILHEKVPVQRPGLQEIAGTYIPAHQVRQFQPLGFSENLMPISIAIIAVVAVKVASFLFAVQGVVGRVKIQDPFATVPVQAIDAELQKTPFQFFAVATDFVGASEFSVSQFQPVEARSPGQGTASILAPQSIPSQRIGLADGCSEQGISAQIMVIVEILVTQSPTEDSLSDQVLRGMFGEPLVSTILETGSDHPAHSQRVVDHPQQQRAAIVAQVAATEIGHNFSRA